MAKFAFAILFAFFALIPGAAALDVDLGFQLGFNVRVRPDIRDASGALGLAVVTEEVLTDREQYLTITGSVVNYSGVQRDGIELHFAVTSHVAIGKSFGRATVAPNCLPPGGVASFTLHLSLDGELPKDAFYTLTLGGR